MNNTPARGHMMQAQRLAELHRNETISTRSKERSEQDIFLFKFDLNKLTFN